MASSASDISRAVERLRKGGVVAFPTETVYGLGADAGDEAAVRWVYELKGRPASNPLIVHVTGPEMAARVGVWDADERAGKLARAFWPGPLTIVVPRREVVSDLVTGGGGTVAVRSPDHPVALALLFEFDGPLVGPSANRSGSVSPTTSAHVREAWGEEVMVLEGGPCRGGIESTVVWIADERTRVLRPGLVSAGEIAEVVGGEVEIGDVKSDGGAMTSPGLLARHYAPATPSELVESAEVAVRLRQLEARDRAVVLGGRETYSQVSSPHEVVEMPDDAGAYAARLYAALREADARGAAVVLIVRPRDNGDPVWGAILDRLNRATARE